MAKGYWAGDSIAQSNERAGEQERVNQEKFKAAMCHAGFIALLRAALA
jgi:hypothetical protein